MVALHFCNNESSQYAFNPVLGNFTVSQQGDYYFDARLIIKGNNNPDFITTDVYVNTGTVYNYTHVAYGIVSPVAFPIGLYLPLNIGDTVNIACYSTGTAGFCEATGFFITACCRKLIPVSLTNGFFYYDADCYAC